MDDIIASINYMNCLARGIGSTDDIDHLGNRRLRSCRRAAAKPVPHRLLPHGAGHPESMTLQAQDLDVLTPQALINIRPVVAAIKEFFGSSPLSQFMDQTNPLAELTHKRRLSSWAPAACPVTAPASRSATYTTATTAACARSRRRKAPTSA